ncbi:MAG: S8 family serine peptidase [Dehalococcoidia bacterium]
MRKSLLITIPLVALGAMVLGIPQFTDSASADNDGRIRDKYVVVLKDGVEPEGNAERHGREDGIAAEHIYRDAVNGYSFRGSAKQAAALAKDPNVKFVAQDREVHAIAQTLPTGVQRIGANVSSTLAGNGSGSVNVGVAIVDTGIQTNHPDLNVVGGKSCVGGSYSDGHGHGTHVAGTVGARDNGSGVVGVAPGTPLYAVRVLDSSGSGSYSSIVCGLNWVAANAATIKVVNMSLGGGGADDGNCGNSNGDIMHMAVCNLVSKGVTVVVAAGNSNIDMASFVPAAYDEVLTVTAIADFNGAPGGGASPTCRTDVDDTSADFSNWTTAASADEAHTIAAPGACIRSTWRGSSYATISGTSMASPHVAGTVALCLASGKCTGTPAQIRAKIRSDAAARATSTPGYGFTPEGGHSYGKLVYAGGY